MSEEELVKAYQNGQITRRVFIRRLIALGVTFSAAVSYSSILRSSSASASISGSDFYDLYDFYCDVRHHDRWEVQVTDEKFVPLRVTTTPGDRVRWRAPASNTETHTVTDRTGMNLYDFTLTKASQVSFQFKAAGRYAYTSTKPHDPGMDGVVIVQVLIEPATGPAHELYTVAWACSSAPAGFVYDVQLKSPGTSWANFRVGTTRRLGQFIPPSAGRYFFRARMRKLSNNKSAGYQSVTLDVT